MTRDEQDQILGLLRVGVRNWERGRLSPRSIKLPAVDYERKLLGLPDGRVVTEGRPGEARVYDAQTGKKAASVWLNREKRAIWYMTQLPDHTVATLTQGPNKSPELQLWSPDDGAIVDAPYIPPFLGAPRSLVAFPDGRVAFSAEYPVPIGDDVTYLGVYDPRDGVLVELLADQWGDELGEVPLDLMAGTDLLVPGWTDEYALDAAEAVMVWAPSRSRRLLAARVVEPAEKSQPVTLLSDQRVAIISEGQIELWSPLTGASEVVTDSNIAPVDQQPLEVFDGVLVASGGGTLYRFDTKPGLTPPSLLPWPEVSGWYLDLLNLGVPGLVLLFFRSQRDQPLWVWDVTNKAVELPRQLRTPFKNEHVIDNVSVLGAVDRLAACTHGFGNFRDQRLWTWSRWRFKPYGRKKSTPADAPLGVLIDEYTDVHQTVDTWTAALWALWHDRDLEIARLMFVAMQGEAWAREELAVRADDLMNQGVDIAHFLLGWANPDRTKALEQQRALLPELLEAWNRHHQHGA